MWQYSARKKALDIALKIPLLSARPMLLAHIPDLVERNVTVRNVYELYEEMINAWLERETFWVNKQALREFSERLAVDIYLNREQRGMEGVPNEELPVLAQRWDIQLQDWQISGRSLLNRDAQGNYKFAHRSIMEYLFVSRLIHGDNNCYHINLTDQMKRLLIERLGVYFPEIGYVHDLIMEVEISVQELDENSNTTFLVLAGDQFFRRLTDDQGLRRLIDDGGFRRLIADQRFRRPVVDKDFKGLAVGQVFRIPMIDQDFKILLENQYFRRLINDPVYRRLTDDQDFKRLIADQDFRRLIDDGGIGLFIEIFGIVQLHHLYNMNKSSQLQMEPSAADLSHFILRIKPGSVQRIV